MGCGASAMPTYDDFLTEQTPPASGFMLGDVASTKDGPVVLRIPCGMSIPPPEPAANCPVMQVVDQSETMIMVVQRAGNEPKSSMFSPTKPLRKPTVVRDAAQRIIGLLHTDAEKVRATGDRRAIELGTHQVRAVQDPTSSILGRAATAQGAHLVHWLLGATALRWPAGRPHHRGRAALPVV